MKECTNVYNFCVKLYNDDPFSFNLDYTKSKIVIFNKMYGDKSKPAPYDILTEEVHNFCSNVKSALKNKKNGHIKKFKMKEKDAIKYQTITIPKKSITNKGIYIY